MTLSIAPPTAIHSSRDSQNNPLMKILLVLTGALIAQFSNCQETFQNLDFELANPVSAHDPGQPSAVTVASALPDWTLYCGTLQQTEVFQNTYSLGQAAGDIFGPNYPDAGAPPNGTPGTIDGNYTAVIQAGTQNFNTFVSTSLEQAGMIPAGDNSLTFKAWAYATTSFSVSFAGNNLPLLNLGTGPNYTLYGADISAYAGQTGLLDFTANAQSAPSLLALDGITFSPNTIPDPNTLALVFLGGVAFGVRAWRKRRS
jgi:hypothetical protein